MHNILRTRDSLMRHCKEFHIPTDWMLDMGILSKVWLLCYGNSPSFIAEICKRIHISFFEEKVMTKSSEKVNKKSGMLEASLNWFPMHGQKQQNECSNDIFCGYKHQPICKEKKVAILVINLGEKLLEDAYNDNTSSP